MAALQRNQILVYQIKVTLDETEPPVWRRILVLGDTRLDELHRILQVVMGWYNYHLHEFTVGDRHYGVPDPEYGFEMRNERRARLSRMVIGEGFSLKYSYDFGDDWVHTLLVEEVLRVDPWSRQLPVCIAGSRACPPEDVGGVWGYADFLEAIADPEHEEHDGYVVWSGGDYDPDEFSLKTINWALAVAL